MYTLIMRRLREAGYTQYEISNFAQPGYDSKHNSMYWRNQFYYGLGAGAHGYMSNHRHVNVKGIEPYINSTRAGLPIMERFEVSPKEAMEDFMMVGLRLLKGVKGEDFMEQFGVTMESIFKPQLDKLVNMKLLDRIEGGYRLSDQGLLLGNEVFGAFID
jgi:coproporphyrinogen III oxidase-like Fe-S oxidoreductase